MSPRKFLSRLWATANNPARHGRSRLTLESLESRDVPSTLSVSDVTVREGTAALGVLDSVGATTLSLNKPRNIAFDDIPGSPHYHDLFVTSHTDAEGSGGQVLRFDWGSQTYQPFVPNGSGGLKSTGGIAFGPDGNLYVSDPSSQAAIFEYDGTTGNFISLYVSPGAGGLSTPYGIKFAPDGNLYVCSSGSNQILKYEGPASPDGVAPGQFLGVFANMQHTGPFSFDFGADGNVYVSCAQAGLYSAPTGSFVDRYYGPSSPLAGQFINTFVSSGAGGLSNSRSILFDQRGDMYVADGDNSLNEVLKYQGPNGPNPGAYIEAYVTSGQGKMDAPNGLAIGPDGNLYVSSKKTNQVLRFGPSAQASFAVTLDSASASPVSVNYTTTNGTAVAGTDYTATSGTITFAPGETSKTVYVPIATVMTGGPTKSYNLNLSAASGATIADGLGVGSVLNRQTKFFVVDGGTPKTYQYGSGGTSEEISPEASGNTAPRGIVSTAAGDKTWVVDANKTVYVYTNHGVLLGSWSAGGLTSSATLTGITTNGTDVWLVDSSADKVYKYTGAASRLSGSQNAASNFKLSNSDYNPQDLVTDGTSLWVVDGSAQKVFKYTVAGGLLGSWTIDSANAHPTGITINPSNVSDIWIVDNVTLKVYQYTAAAGRTSGSQSASSTFALNPYDTNPQGIADPPPAEMLLPVASPEAVLPASIAQVASTPPLVIESDATTLLGVLVDPVVIPSSVVPKRAVAATPRATLDAIAAWSLFDKSPFDSATLLGVRVDPAPKRRLQETVGQTSEVTAVEGHTESPVGIATVRNPFAVNRAASFGLIGIANSKSEVLEEGLGIPRG